MADEIECECDADGTVHWNTGRISDKNHDAADEFQKALEEALGGKVVRNKRVAKGPHVHHKGHVHQHGEEH